MELLLREDEALEALRVSRTTLWRLRRDGELRVVRIGRAVRYPASEIRRWVDEHLDGPDTESDVDVQPR